MTFRKDLYAGAAADYHRFRPPYPTPLLDDLRHRVPLRAESRVIDLACGTGQIAFGLAPHVGEVWAVDQESDMIEFGRGEATRLGVGNIRWITAAAERVALDGRFDLVAVGNAFHRLERAAVARRLIDHLRPGGCIALLWSNTPWNGDQPWQQALRATLDRWRDRLGAHDRVPPGWQEAIRREPHAEVLADAGLTYEGGFEFPQVHRWTPDSLIGLVYSTSFLGRAVVGHHAEAFENDVRTTLAEVSSRGSFDHDPSCAYELARLAEPG